jgi:hypothetical protein
MKTAAEEVAYRAVDMTTDKRVPFQLCLSDSQMEDTMICITDTDRNMNQRERVIHGITSKELMWFTIEFCMHLVEFEAWWRAISILKLHKTIAQCVIISDIQRCIM